MCAAPAAGSYRPVAAVPKSKKNVSKMTLFSQEGDGFDMF